MEINIARDGIKNTDEPLALIYYGRYEVQSWAELYFAAVKTLYIEYPEVISSLVSKDPSRALYLRTTTIDMKQPARISTILYLDVSRTPEQIVKALREIFRRAKVLNINMSIDVKRPYNVSDNTNEEVVQSNLQNPEVNLNLQNLPKAPEVIKQPIVNLEVPSFMKGESIRKVSIKEQYIEQMKYFVKNYPQRMKKEAGIFLNNRQVTLAESGYRYFKEEVEIGEGLSIEVSFSNEEMKENLNYYQQIIRKYAESS